MITSKNILVETHQIVIIKQNIFKIYSNTNSLQLELSVEKHFIYMDIGQKKTYQDFRKMNNVKLFIENTII